MSFMYGIAQFARVIVRMQLQLPVLFAQTAQEETLVGGQAVMEGVMMRSPHAWGIAVRKPAREGATGEIVLHSEELDKPNVKRRFWGWPVLRGLATLGQAMMLGMRALQFSTNVALEALGAEEAEAKGGEAERDEPMQLGPWAMALNLVLSLAIFIGLYKFLPLLAATALKNHFPVFGHWLIFNLVDGGIRLAIFLVFMWGLSLMPDIRRMFEYHGAEHKTVFAFEAGDELTVDNVQRHSTFHPRCGTSFLITIMLFSILIYACVPVQTFWARFAVRIVLLPLVLGLSYELIRFAAKHRGSAFALLTAPGLWSQRITTRQPDAGQVECAIAALNESMRLELERGGERALA